MSVLAPAEEASFYSRYTYTRHLVAATLDAVAGGVLLLNEFVARKALGAPDRAIVVLLMLPSVAQLVNLYWTGIGVRDPRSVFLWIGIPARLALVAIGWVHQMPAFIVLAMVASTAATVLIPAQNALYQANYRSEERGRLFARVSMASAAVTVLVSTGLGRAYDRDEGLYRLAYPLAGLVAALGSWQWYRIRWRRRDREPDLAPAAARLSRGLLDPFRAAARLFAEDRDFLRFEAAFMTYGMAFMMLQPVLPIYLVDEMRVDYTQAAYAKGLLFYAVNIVFLPLAGRLNDRLGSLAVAALSFLSLSLFPAILVLAPLFAARVAPIAAIYVAYAVFGAAMAGVNVTWTLGPLSLAGAKSAERYMGTHVALVGIRGLLGYPLGVLLMRWGTARLTFAVASLLELAAAAMMWSLVRRRDAAASPVRSGSERT